MGFIQGVETVDNEYFITEDNVGMLKLAKEANTILVSTYELPTHTKKKYVTSFANGTTPFIF